MMNTAKIGFLGAGRMATAIAGGMVKAGFDPAQMMAYDCSAEAGRTFAEATGVAAVGGAAVLAERCDALVLAVKPQYLAAALDGLGRALREKLIISIVAGVKLEKLAALTEARRVIRVMPNTPALVGAGCGAYAVSDAVSDADRALAQRILAAIGDFSELAESHLDAVTAVSGCGPAYVYELIQAMADGGVTLGLPRHLALKLAAQTVRGAAMMVMETQAHPTELRDQVCSPGGATIQGVNVLARHAFSSAVIEAEIAAYERSVELGKK